MNLLKLEPCSDLRFLDVLECDFMIPGNNKFMFVRHSAKPSVELLYFILHAHHAPVSGMEEDIGFGEFDHLMFVMRVAQTHETQRGLTRVLRFGLLVAAREDLVEELHVLLFLVVMCRVTQAMLIRERDDRGGDEGWGRWMG